tara:strand:- start:274 stop:528 length:255 start_codon:yes stop_codon:yes gene_type:complete
MGRMSYIHHLCETDNKKGLIEELGSTRMAEGFLEAHREMRGQMGSVTFGKLNEIVDDSINEYRSQCCDAKIIHHDICSSCKEHI